MALAVSRERPTIPITMMILGLVGCASGPPDTQPLQVFETPLSSLDSFEPQLSTFEGFLSYAFALDTDEQGNIYILDQKERRIVVLDPDLRVSRTIGGQGLGPGEFEFRDLGANAHRVAVRDGILAVDDSRQTVHIFRTDGTYVTRFHIQNEGIADIELTLDGNVLLATHDQEHSLWEYTTDGRELRRYGRPLVSTGLDYRQHSWVGRFLSANQCEVAALSDGKVVTIGIYWPRLRVYDDGHFVSEADIDLMRLAEAALPKGSSQVQESLRYLVTSFREHPPEAINEAARNGTLTADFPRPTVRMSLHFESLEEQMFCHLGGFALFEVCSDGSIPCVIRLGSDPIEVNGLGFSRDRVIALNPGSSALLYADLPW